MKSTSLIILCLTAALFSDGQVQRVSVFPRSAYIEPYRLEVTINKTSHLIFPDAITSIDRGSQDIIVQKAEGTENILKIKAGTKGFEETNLSIITKDGRLYSFLVKYSSAPEYLNLRIDPPSGGLPPDSYPASQETQPLSTPNGVLKTSLGKLMNAKSNVAGVWKEKARMYAAVDAFYVAGEVMYCRLQLANYSVIDFTLEVVRFYIRDKKSGKRIASQEMEVTPHGDAGNGGGLKGKASAVFAFALPKFTIPDGKYLAIQINERGGERHLLLKLKKRHVMRAGLLY